MHARIHPLSGSAPGTRREIHSVHYGPQGNGRKAYLQAALHADELPGMLVVHHLRRHLQALEADGRLRGEVVVVPVANPIGLAQTVLGMHAGRFELGSGDNFNRHYPALFPAAVPLLEGRLGAAPEANAALVRSVLRDLVAGLAPETEQASQRQTLLGLACDAEVVIDLHCDDESLLHLYTGTDLWPQCEPLARYTGARASLLARESGDDPFDEACSRTWWQLEEHFRGRHPIPFGCLGVTLELRGLADVSHATAGEDAAALVAFLTHRGLIDGPVPALPPLREPATALDATDVLKAPVSGVLVYARELGERVRAGDVIFEVLDPLGDRLYPVASRTDGLLFARQSQRYARAGRAVAKVAGAVPVRTGKLSSD